jgi:DNA (cytosine-5)-methyltransferase 1
MDHSNSITHVGLCAGYGGIDLGLKRAVPNLRTIALSEIEAFACANLAAKMEAGLLDPAPVWTDLKTFPYAAFHGRVDLLSGGYPCQPFSAAGKRLGREDPRHLWPWIADGIRAVQPGVCFFENVEGHISLGLREVIEELEALGYRTTWGIFSAAEVGAPHRRKRVFILADRVGQGLERYAGDVNGEGRGFGRTDRSVTASGLPRWPARPGEDQFWWEPPRTLTPFVRIANRHGPDQRWKLAHAQHTERREETVGGVDHFREENSGGFGECGSELAHAQGKRSGEARGLRPDGPEDGTSGQSEDVLCGSPQPSLGRNSHGSSDRLDPAVSVDSRIDELRLLGNGVVPAVAEHAFRTLLRRQLTPSSTQSPR